MKVLFDTAKAAIGIAPDELETLFAEPSYEARMAAFCILDFQARRRLGDLELRATYLRHHDRIDAWDMVDRAAPRVVGATLTGGPYDLCASSPRRPTRPSADCDDRPPVVCEVRRQADVEAGIAIAEALHADPDPLVHKPVGIYLAYAGDRLPERLTGFLDRTVRRCPARRTASRFASAGQQATAEHAQA